MAGILAVFQSLMDKFFILNLLITSAFRKEVENFIVVITHNYEFLISDGHTLSKQLENQVKKAGKRSRQLLMEYSFSGEQLSNDDKTCFREPTSDSIKQRKTFGVDDTSDETRAIPLAIKCHAIEMLNLQQRSKEEKHFLKQEMVSIHNYYVKDKENVANCASILSSIQEEDRNRFEFG